MSLSPHPRNGLPEDKVRGWKDKWLRPLDGSEITPARIVVGVVAGLLVLGALIAANVVTTDFGFIPVGFGFEATAGTLFAGVMLASRDAVQDALGRWAVVVMILLGTIVSLLISDPHIALAAALAFGFAELADFAVYTPIRNRSIIGDKRWALAVVASNAVGALADSVIFLGIAFGLGAITPALPGQMVGKLWATLAYLLIGWVVAKAILNPLRKAGRLGQPSEKSVEAT